MDSEDGPISITALLAAASQQPPPYMPLPVHQYAPLLPPKPQSHLASLTPIQKRN